MKSAKNLVLLLFALGTAGGALVAWQQYQELILLRAATLDRDDRANLQRRLSEAQKRTRDLEAQLAAQTLLPEKNPVPAPTATVAAEAAGRGDSDSATSANPRLAPRSDMFRMMDQPEMQQLMALQQKLGLDGRYADLFKALKLPPEQLEKFKTLLVDKQTALQDIMAAARAEGVSRKDVNQLVASTQAEIENNIRATLGEESYAQYQQYQQTLPQRSVVNQLQQSLSYSSAPLSDAQAEQMIKILASSNPSAHSTSSVIPGRLPSGPGYGGAPITSSAVTLAQGVLTPVQLQALQQLQQVQQAQQQLQQQIQQSMRNRGSTTSPGTSTPTSSSPQSR